MTRGALITGVCGGIGGALAQHLKRLGWRVYGVDLVNLKTELELDGFWQGDASLESFWLETIVPGLSAAKPLTGFVHNAAIQPCCPVLEMSVADWDQVMSVNLRMAFLGVRHLVPLMDSTDGSIVNIASVHAFATSPGMAAYVASKGALEAFTRASALELAERNVRVNAVLPGAVDTQMLRDGLARASDGLQSAKTNLISRTPLKRTAKPEEIALAIEFLLDSNKSAFVTGQSLVVDGGALARLSTE